jgi:hypothetical protein
MLSKIKTGVNKMITALSTALSGRQQREQRTINELIFIACERNKNAIIKLLP